MRKARPHSNNKGFTLAELLVVIAIIGIMFAIALPTISNITGQTRLESAANALHSAVKMARQHAIANNQPTYLVFHTSSTDPALAYRAYAVFTINTHSPPVQESDGEFITPWTTLPAGLVFDMDSNPTDNIFNINTGQAWNGAFSENSVLKIDGETYTVVGFLPSGKTSTSTGWTRQIILTEGSLQNSGLIRTSTEGKEIRINLRGQSRIVDLLYDENTEPGELEI